MNNPQLYNGKTIQSIDYRNGGEQMVLYFTDESFLIITAEVRGGYERGCGRAVGELTFRGRALDN